MGTRPARRHPDRHRTNPAVVIAWLSDGNPRDEFTGAVLDVLWQDAHLPERERLCVRPEAGYFYVQTGPRIAAGRCEMIQKFLDHYPDCEWLLSVDSDMQFTAADVRTLLEVADARDRPIVGGLCFRGMVGGEAPLISPVIFDLQIDDSGVVTPGLIDDYPEDALVKVGGTGAAFLLVHRNVFLAMAQPHPAAFGTFPDGRPNPFPWFAEGGVDRLGNAYGEDVAFCMRAQMLNIPVFVHTGVKIGHVKPSILDERLFRVFHPKPEDASERWKPIGEVA